MTLEEIRALVAADLVAVDDVIRDPPEELRSPWWTRSPSTSSPAAASACARCWWCWRPGACAAASGERPPRGGRLHRVHPYRHAAARRRGRRLLACAAAATPPTRVFGNQASVLVGDFVYSRAFQMMAALGSQRVMEIMADATNVIAEGEVLQLMNAQDPDTTEQRYLEVIYRKTAQAVRGRRGGRRGAVPSVAPEVQARACHATAGTWAPRTSSSTMCSTTAPTRASAARTSAMTWPRASPRCR